MWTKLLPLEIPETWFYEDVNGRKKIYPIRIFNDKDFDVIGLKETSLDGLKLYFSFVNDLTSKVFRNSQSYPKRLKCLCCNSQLNAISKDYYFHKDGYNK